MFNKSVIVCAVALLMSANVWAEPDYLEPPVIPEPLMDGQNIEPDVNIIQKKNRTIEEYRVNGKLYMIKVVPTIGLPYFLMDTDGDGSLDTTQHELDSGLLIPNWILLEW
jgi:hypothetical protein